MLQERINKEYIQAMKDKNGRKKDVLSLLKTSITEEEKNNNNQTLTDAQIMPLILKAAKQRDQLIDSLKDKGPDYQSYIDAAVAERSIIEEFLPKQLTQSEVETIIDEQIAAGSNNMGALMKHFSTNYAGQYNSKELSSTVKSKLS